MMSSSTTNTSNQPVTNPETGSTVPPSVPASGNRYTRRRTKPVKPGKPQPSPEMQLAQLRAAVFNRAHETLTLLNVMSEAARCDHPDRLELTEAIRLTKDALVAAGLDYVRPIIALLKASGSPVDAKATFTPPTA